MQFSVAVGFHEEIFKRLFRDTPLHICTISPNVSFMNGTHNRFGLGGSRRALEKNHNSFGRDIRLTFGPTLPGELGC